MLLFLGLLIFLQIVECLLSFYLRTQLFLI